MPIEHKVHPEENLLRIRRWGHISTHDEAKAFEVRRADPLVVPGICVLVDCTAVDPPDNTEAVKYIASCTTQLAAKIQCGPLAIIVNTDIEYGMARMYMGLTGLSHPQSNVFRSEAEALAWLRTEKAL
jgi:S-adenosylmethionine synthetase